MDQPGDEGSRTCLGKKLPLTDFKPFQQFPPYYTWVDNEFYDKYRAQMDVDPRFNKVLVPALVGTDSYDVFAVDSVRTFQGMRSSGGTYEARVDTKMVDGAYGHPGDSGHPTFGNERDEGEIGFAGLAILKERSSFLKKRSKRLLRRCRGFIWER